MPNLKFNKTNSISIGPPLGVFDKINNFVGNR